MDSTMLEKKAFEIRKSVLEMCIKAKTGHVTSSFSCVEILVALYHGGILRHNPKNPDWGDRDRFILSKGQASVLLYPVLADLGYFPKSDLDSFCQEDGKFGVHLQYTVPGVEITAGSLGIGFGVAAGLAMSAKMNREKFMTVALLGDGELYEGSIWETAMLAAHHRLNNLIAIIDRNYICATDFTENLLRLEPLEAKWESFGWKTLRIDGHNFSQIFKAFEGWRSMRNPQPMCIICDTVKGRGIDYMSDRPLWHGGAPVKTEDVDRARDELAKGGFVQ